MNQASFSLRGRNPDVLTCIANLSNDEAFTPREFANRIVDRLAETWATDNGGTLRSLLCFEQWLRLLPDWTRRASEPDHVHV